MTDVRRPFALALVSVAACSNPPGRLGPTDASTDGCVGARCDASVDASTIQCEPETPAPVVARLPSAGRALSAAATLDGLHAVMVAQSSSGGSHELLKVRVGTDGTSSVTSLGSVTTPASAGVVLLPTATGFVLFHSDAGDVQVRTLDVSGAPTAADAPLRATAADERLVAATSTGTGYALVVAIDGAPTLVSLDSAFASAAADVPLGTVTSPEFLTVASTQLAFVDASGYVAAVPVTSPAATPTRWSAFSGVVGFAVAPGVVGGGFLYEAAALGGHHSGQFRAIDPAGTATYAERSLAGPVAQAFEPSLTSAGGGFLALHRHVPDDQSAPVMRLTALSTFGDTVSTRDLLTDVRGPSRSVIRTAPDGRVSMLFEVLEARDAGDVAQLYAARLVCR